MQDKTKESFLDILIGEKLSSVTFVMDYLQVDLTVSFPKVRPFKS
jgi:hypothetical protein